MRKRLAQRDRWSFDASQRKGQYKPLVAAWIVAGMGIFVSLAIFGASSEWEAELYRHELVDEATTHGKRLETKIRADLKILPSIRVFHAATDEIDGETFRSFAENIIAHHEGIGALEWAPRVRAAERAAFEATVRSNGDAGFSIRERSAAGELIVAGRRDEYFPVLYIEPLEGNEPAFGFDLASEPTRRDGLSRARDSADPVVSGRVRLVQETSDQYGFLAFLAIYRDGVEPKTVAERREQLEGFALGVFRLGEIMDPVLNSSKHSHELNFYLYDGSAPPDSQLLYVSNAGAAVATPPETLAAAIAGDHSAATAVSFAGQTWTLVVEASAGLEHPSQAFKPWLVLATGLVLTAALVAYLVQQHRRTREISALVDERTKRLRREIKRTNMLMSVAADAIITIDSEGTIHEFNPAAERIFGYEMHELHGENVKVLMPEPYHSGHDGYIEHFLTTGEAKAIGSIRELTGLRKDGRTFPMELAVANAELDGEKMFIGIARDVTDRMVSEQMLAMHADELARSNDDLEEFAYIASHDLRAPLRAINNLATWIEEDLEDKLDGETRENMTLMRERIKRMETLLEDLLKYSRAGRLESSVEWVDAGELVEGIAALLDRPKAIAVAASGELPRFEAEKAPLEVVFRNLISNAIKHHDRGDGRIEVSARDEGAFYAFAVADDGPGIPAEHHDRVFKMFQTLKPRDEVEGSGMGLAVVKKLVERQGGTINVESVPGERGTTFRFLWPKQQTQKVA